MILRRTGAHQLAGTLIDLLTLTVTDV